MLVGHRLVRIAQNIIPRRALKERTGQLQRAETLLRESQSVNRERERTIEQRETAVRRLELLLEEKDAEIERLANMLTLGPGKFVSEGAAAEVIVNALPGWCNEQKARWLIELLHSDKHRRRVVEVGVFGGRSLFPMALALKGCAGAVVYAVEPWSNEIAIAEATSDANDEWWGKVDLIDVKTQFLGAIVRLGMAGLVRVIELRSDEACAALSQAAPFDLIHIDGAHASTQALRDVQQWSGRLARGGILVLDDIEWVSVQPARAFVRQSLRVIDEVVDVIDGGGVLSYGAYIRD